MQQELEILLTAKDVADCFSVSVRTIWRWAAEGRIPAPLRLTRRAPRWKASEIQAFLDSHSSAPQPH